MKIFENQGVAEKILPYSEFKLFRLCDFNEKNAFCSDYRGTAIEKAEKFLNYEIPITPISLYREFYINGNRTNYETVYFERYNALCALIYGEMFERKGRFIPKMTDLIWSMLEETTWILPAHNCQIDGVELSHTQLPFDYTGDVSYVDLFSAVRAAMLSFAYYFFEDEFEKEFPEVFCERLLFEINRRVLTPFENLAQNFWWSGLRGNYVNNWNPWIITNTLTTIAICEKNDIRRKSLFEKAILCLDNYMKVQPEDGSCEEGASYWGVAGQAVLASLSLIYDFTGGKCDFYKLDIIKGMCEFLLKINIYGNSFINYSDCPHKVDFSASALYHFGKLTGDELVCDFAAAYGKRLSDDTSATTYSLPYLTFSDFKTSISKEKGSFTHSDIYNVSCLEIVNSRKKINGHDIFYSTKGNHNGESHGHQDCGSFMVYADALPLFIDLGIESYCKKTFSDERNKIWCIRSVYHNTMNFGEAEECAGGKYRAHDFELHADNSVSMRLEKAYPENSGIISYERKTFYDNDSLNIVDNFVLDNEKEVCENLISRIKPEIHDNEVIYKLSASLNAVLHFSNSLSAELDEIDVTNDRLAVLWDTEYVYRLRLKEKSSKDELKMKITFQSKGEF